MHVDALYALGPLAFGAPVFACAVILVYYYLRRAAWKRNKRLRKKNLGFCPSSSSMGNALQVLQEYYQPGVAYVLEAKMDEDAEENDEGDPETVTRQLNRQLRQIRRGEPVERLVLRL